MEMLLCPVEITLRCPRKCSYENARATISAYSEQIRRREYFSTSSSDEVETTILRAIASRAPGYNPRSTVPIAPENSPDELVLFSPQNPPAHMELSLEPQPSRSTLRERERNSRARRAARLARQHQTLQILEIMASIVPALIDGEDEDTWDAVLDPAARTVLSRFRPFVRVKLEQRQLERDHAVLMRLLQEHRLASDTIERLLEISAKDDWDACVKKWRAITLKYYEPMSMEDCAPEIEAAQKELNAFLWSEDTEEIGASFFGWRVRRRLVSSRDAVQFCFEKTIRGYPMTDFAHVAWDLYTDLHVYQSLMDQRVRCWLDVLQKVTPDLWIVREAEGHPSLSINVHKLYLVVRRRSKRRALQFARSLFAPQIQTKTAGESDMWASNFVWLAIEAVNEDATDYRVQTGGTISGQDPNYAAQWLMGTLAVLLRIEQTATKRGLLKSESASS